MYKAKKCMCSKGPPYFYIVLYVYNYVFPMTVIFVLDWLGVLEWLLVATLAPMVLLYLSRYVIFMPCVRILFPHKFQRFPMIRAAQRIYIIFKEKFFKSVIAMDCDKYLLSGSWNCTRYSRKRHGQPHRLAAQCGHDAEAHGSAWPC